MILRILTVLTAVVLCSCAPRVVIYGQIGHESPEKQDNYKIVLRGEPFGFLRLEDAAVFSDGAFRISPRWGSAPYDTTINRTKETVCFYKNDTVYAVYEFETRNGRGLYRGSNVLIDEEYHDLSVHEFFSKQKVRLSPGDKVRLEIEKTEYSPEQLNSVNRLCDDIEKGKHASYDVSPPDFTLAIEGTRASGCNMKTESRWRCGWPKKCYDEEQYYSCLDEASENKLREYEAACKNCEPLPARTWVNGTTIHHTCCPQIIRLDQEEGE